MSRPDSIASLSPHPPACGWRGIGLIAITYVYFLIFAQFAFLKRLAALGITDQHLKAVMGSMALGGILLSLLAPRVARFNSPGLRLRAALVACASAALLSTRSLSLDSAIAVSALIGAGLGLLTVTLVTHLRLWIGDGNPLLGVALGTGLGYFACNIPAFFTAPATLQAFVAAALALAGLFLAASGRDSVDAAPSNPLPSATRSPILFPAVLAAFIALIWLDSAAFFIIQTTPALKAGTWRGSLHLWTNASLHLLAALAALWILRRLGLGALLAAAFLALAGACLLLLDPNRAPLASVFYPVGVSLYSVALVAYPALLATAPTPGDRARQAGWIYALAGWCGSALGIGMGQNLGHVPWAFVLAAGLVVLAPLLLSVLRTRRRELAAAASVLACAWGLDRAATSLHPAFAAGTAVDRGRQVYISEGCISCHSQYVRPGTRDVLMWGPTQSLVEIRHQHPPLIGNRRQGPDLSEVGSRRSPLWLRVHFLHPAELSYRSFMPSFAYLFRDHRGDDLLAYLESLRAADLRPHLAAEAAWQPAADDFVHADAQMGATLYAEHCATCHDSDGATRRRWLASFRVPPQLLPAGPWRVLHPNLRLAEQQPELARIIRFGIPGTDMPGREYLDGCQVAALVLYLAQTGSPPASAALASHLNLRIPNRPERP